MMQICPEGFICPLGTTSMALKDVGTATGMKLCPDGYWCPEGSTNAIIDVGTYLTP
jgi:hypothetical protein